MASTTTGDRSGATWATVRRYLAFDRGRGTIPELDGLRALAILLVVARHGVVPYWDGAGSLFPIGRWDAGIPLVNGWIGVDLFFVLSGFLITHHICSRYGRGFGRDDLGDYVRRRVLRIVPLYFVVLFIAALGLFPLYTPPPGAMGVRVAYHLLFLQDYLPSNIIVVFWSLGVEEKFYLVAPVLMIGVFALPRTWRFAALAVLALVPTGLRFVTALARPDVTDYAAFFPVFRSPFHLTFDGLVLGALCALVVREGRGPRRESRAAHACFWGGAVVLGWLLGAEALLDRIDLFDKVALEAVLAVAVSAVLLGLVSGGGPTRWFARPSLFFFSKISYSLYLVHYPMVPVGFWLVAALGADTLPRAVQFLVFLPLYSLLSVVVAVFFHYVVEKPFLLMKDRLPRRPTPRLEPRLAEGA